MRLLKEDRRKSGSDSKAGSMLAIKHSEAVDS